MNLNYPTADRVRALATEVGERGCDLGTTMALRADVCQLLDRHHAIQDKAEGRNLLASEARELDRTFAAPVRKSGSKSSFISLSVEDEEPKADQPVVATARFSLRGPAENGLKTVEILRAKASDLVDLKNEDERSAAWARRATSVKNIADLARRPGVVLDERFELDMKEAAMIGKPDEIIERLNALAARGVDNVLLLNVSATRKFLEFFAREIMPHVNTTPLKRVANA